VPTNNYPFYHTVVLTSRSGEQVAAYGTTYPAETRPRYIILPQLRDFSNGIIGILQCLESVWPQLFPDKIKQDWISGDEFLLPEERRIGREIEAVIANASRQVGLKKQELASVIIENAFVRDLLTATEDAGIDPDHRLKAVVKKALHFLGFHVEDIDEKLRTVIKKEDLWVRDGEFLAITEVAGTVHKNPKIKEFNDILGRMTTIYRRQTDLQLPKDVAVSGLLVLNFDVNTHPSKRPRPYTSGDEHIIASAIEQGIGILSTVELHKMVVAVKENVLSKQVARALLKRNGRIEFDANQPET